MGRYVPPEHEGVLSGNQLSKKHPLGSRANKASQGILTVRFEMPFAVWCTQCTPHAIIGQGVRFNAEKRRVGKYHSTPIWAFRMRHTACGGTIEIRTDPKAAEYVVIEGGKRRDYGEGKDGPDAEGAFGGKILTEEERNRRREDAFAALEGKVEDKTRAKMESDRVEELKRDRQRDWEDPYAASQRLRRTFRAERKLRARKEQESEALKDRLGLGIELLEEDDADRARAGLVEFGVLGSKDDAAVAQAAAAKPLFDLLTVSPSTKQIQKSKTKIQVDGERRKLMLQQELKGNTRAVMDPFSVDAVGLSSNASGRLIPGLRRQPRESHTEESGPDTISSSAVEVNSNISPTQSSIPVLPLVDYDSD